MGTHGTRTGLLKTKLQALPDRHLFWRRARPDHRLARGSPGPMVLAEMLPPEMLHLNLLDLWADERSLP
jgi:hypothetical protein